MHSVKYLLITTFLLISTLSKGQNSSSNEIPSCITNYAENYIAFRNPKTTLHAEKSYTFMVEYSVLEDCEIATSFWKNNTWVASKVAQTAKGSGIRRITVDLPSFPENGKGYSYKTHIRPVGTDWQHALDTDEVDDVVIIPTIDKKQQDIEKVSKTDILQQQQIFSLDISSIHSTNTIQTDVILYPNPASDYVKIRGIEPGETIIVYDWFGAVVMQFIADQREEVILTSGLNKGTYVVSVSGKSRQQLRVK